MKAKVESKVESKESSKVESKGGRTQRWMQDAISQHATTQQLILGASASFGAVQGSQDDPASAVVVVAVLFAVAVCIAWVTAFEARSFL